MRPPTIPHTRFRLALVAAMALSLVATVPTDDADAAVATCQGRTATIVGTEAADVLYGTDGDDVIAGLGGDDVIFAGGGNDVVCGGPGNDFLYGQGDDDVIDGGAGSDLIEGGGGSDQIFGGAGSDELWGSSCTPPAGLAHFCRTPPVASAPAADGGTGDSADPAAGDGYAALLDGTRILRWGSTGDDVAALQRLLNDLGFSVGTVDGKYGPMTAAAVRDFQASRGLSVDGAVGPQTRGALEGAAGGPVASPVDASFVGFSSVAELFGSSRLLRPGHRGDDVAALQQLLNDLGFSAGPVDGVFGSQTAAAVRTFQSQHGLVADGVVGPQTKAAMIGDSGAGDGLSGGGGYDTCNSPDEGAECENSRGLRSGAPRNAAAAEEWRPLVTEVFTEWNLSGEIDRALAIVACESLADPFITTPTSPEGAQVVGLFQHKDIYWANRASNAGIPGGDIFNPRDNTVVAAYLVSQSLDHANGPWAHFACGSILGFWNDGS